MEGARANNGRVIVEGFVDFDYEITLLTIRHKDGVSFCAPIGHRQEHGDYRESWQPHPMSAKALEAAKDIATKVVNELGGRGIFGVEFFVKYTLFDFDETARVRIYANDGEYYSTFIDSRKPGTVLYDSGRFFVNPGFASRIFSKYAEKSVASVGTRSSPAKLPPLASMKRFETFSRSWPNA